jgi:transcription elongation factor GreA
LAISEYVTIETFEKMREELQRMKTVDRSAAARAIAEAREKGDLNENAEYDSAKEAQGLLEARIKQLEGIIANSKIVDPESIDTIRVAVLTKVTVLNMATKKTFTYQIVGEKEANLKERIISASSPIGKGLLGKSVDVIAGIQAPAGVIKFKVEHITI